MATRRHTSRSSAGSSSAPQARRATPRRAGTRVSRRASHGPDGPTALRKRPRQARARATFDAVLEAAAALIARQGYAETTTNHIAARAGVSVGSLYQYFPNKTAILVSLFERHIREIQPTITSALADLQDPAIPFEDGLRRLFVRLLAMHEENPRLHEVLSEEVPHPPSIQRLRRTLEGGYASRVAEILHRSRRPGHGRRRRGVHLLAGALGAAIHRPAALRGRSGEAPLSLCSGGSGSGASSLSSLRGARLSAVSSSRSSS
jgi:AcrR family transcriptional regulator